MTSQSQSEKVAKKPGFSRKSDREFYHFPKSMLQGHLEFEDCCMKKVDYPERIDLTALELKIISTHINSSNNAI
jgi:hypothetical protein